MVTSTCEEVSAGLEIHLRRRTIPTYDLRNTTTGEVEEHIVSISKKEEMVASGDYEQVHHSVAQDNIISQHNGTLSRTSGDWRDLLKRMKKGSGRDNHIKTY